VAANATRNGIEVTVVGRNARRGWFALVVGALLAAPALLMPQQAHAQVGGSSPASGSVGPGNGASTTWTFDPVAGAGSGGTPLENACAPGHCSRFPVEVKLPQPDTEFYAHYIAVLTYTCSWDNSNTGVPTDVDCFTFAPSGAKQGPGAPDDQGPKSFEQLTVTDPASGTWSLRADAGVVPQPTTVTGVVTLTYKPVVEVAARAAQAGQPRFSSYDFDPAYQKTDALHRPDAGEPSMGVDPATGAVMYMAGNQVTRITYSGDKPPKATTTDVTPLNSQGNEDAILYTDPVTHRTWALGLLLAASHLAYSDDDGATWTPSVAFSPPAAPDHETLASGPYHGTPPTSCNGTCYGRAVYYCAQTIVQDAYCGRSDDGGMTFSAPATPLWNNVCSPIHGHVRVGPTGLVYVPNGKCKDGTDPRVGVAVSADDGQSFTVYMPKDSSPSTSDPSVMEGPDGTIYLGYQASNGHPMVVTGTHDNAGKITWGPSIDVGGFRDAMAEGGMPFGVQNTEFAEIITGDPGRAAFAFLGTGRPGSDQAGDYAGAWYLYVSFTYDGGKSWNTVNATPNGPVQRGCVWNGGLVNACRNMLDFNDIGVDKIGHVYVAYTDGCTISDTYNCKTTPGIHGWNDVQSGDQTGCGPSEGGSVLSTSTCTFARLSAVVRQVCGRGLVASADPGFTESPDCPIGGSTGPLATGTHPVPTAPQANGGNSGNTGGTATPAVNLPNTSPTGAAPGVAALLSAIGVAGLLAATRRRRTRR
jgi:hypothetical protein